LKVNYVLEMSMKVENVAENRISVSIEFLINNTIVTTPYHGQTLANRTNPGPSFQL
jgi:hypothetical protein